MSDTTHIPPTLDRAAEMLTDVLVLLEAEEVREGHPIHHLLVNARLLVTGSAWRLRRAEEVTP